MRRSLIFLLACCLAVLSVNAHAQVMQSTSFMQEIKRAESLIAGNASTDIPHHIHYDLKLYDRDGHESSATYDVYRDPLLYTRVDAKAGDYELTRITNVRDHVEWLHYTGNMPLKLFDFEQVFDRPYTAIERLKAVGRRLPPMSRQEFSGAPLLCAADEEGFTICFNPFIHLFSYAQMFDQTVMYDQWLPVGSHSVPGSIRIFQGKKLLMEATGTVEAIKKFPEHLMEIPSTPSMPRPETAHKVKEYKPVQMKRMSYGNVQVAVSADAEGKVEKVDIIDSDGKDLEGYARKTAKSILFEPQMESGHAVPFDTVLYLHYDPSML